MVGAFWQPRFVAIDTDTLRTLPQRETLSGWAEIVKYGVILDAVFFEYLEANVNAIAEGDDQVLALAIKRSCELKGEVVSQDERELTGLRAILNYGHTFAHAIEATVGYGVYLHGEAVAIGMQMAARLAERLGRVSSEFSVRQETLLRNLRLPTSLPDPEPHTLIRAMESDKKVAYGKLRFILPKRLGEVELVADIDSKLVHDAILDCSTTDRR
jgi:3-dehydroquinate synthase